MTQAATRPVDKACLKIHCIEEMTISIEVKPDPQLAALSTVFLLFLFRDVVVSQVGYLSLVVRVRVSQSVM